MNSNPQCSVKFRWGHGEFCLRFWGCPTMKWKEREAEGESQWARGMKICEGWIIHSKRRKPKGKPTFYDVYDNTKSGRYNMEERRGLLLVGEAGLATKGSCQGPWQEVPWHLGRKMFCYWTTLAGRVLPSPAPWQEDEFFPCHLGRKIFLVLILKLNFWAPPDLWCCGSVKWSPITEVKQRWAWLVLGWETTPLC